MKRLILIISCFVFAFSHAATIKGGVSEFEALNAFYGSWHVTSKIHESNNPTMFNPISVDIWALSGAGNILILENELSGAKSNIEMDINNIQGKTLKFERKKIENLPNGIKKVYTETPVITLNGDIFQGFDTFVIEEFKNSTLLNKNMVVYKVVGQKLSGESKNK